MNLFHQYSHSAIVFPVQNLAETVKYYVDNLDFQITFEWGNPTDYVVGKLGNNTAIHFTQNNQPVKFDTSLYVFVHDVDAVHEILKKRNLNIGNPIGNREYGMRDFDIYDINDVEWAIATRFQADKDAIIMPDQPGSSLDPSGDLTEGRKATSCKMGLDATVPCGKSDKSFKKESYKEVDLNKFL